MLVGWYFYDAHNSTPVTRSSSSYFMSRWQGYQQGHHHHQACYQPGRQLNAARIVQQSEQKHVTNLMRSAKEREVAGWRMEFEEG